MVQDEAGAEAAGATDEGEKEGEEDEEEEEEANEAALEAREIKWHLPEGLKVCNKPLLVLDDSLVGCLIFMRWNIAPRRADRKTAKLSGARRKNTTNKP